MRASETSSEAERLEEGNQFAVQRVGGRVEVLLWNQEAMEIAAMVLY
jgi:hypothetical protein